jgi:hypothetical protein
MIDGQPAALNEQAKSNVEQKKSNEEQERINLNLLKRLIALESASR